MSNNTSDKVHNFFSQYKLVNYKKGETILRPDVESSSVFYIKSGFVKSYHLFDNGKELIFTIYKPRSYFPILWIIGNVQNPFYFQAMTAVSIYKAPDISALTFLKKDSDVLLDLTRRVAVGLNGLLSNMKYVYFGTAYSRIVSTLIIVANRFGEKTGRQKITIQIPFTHEDIGNLAGLTRETTSLEMEKLIKKKLIYYSGKLIVVNNTSLL